MCWVEGGGGGVRGRIGDWLGVGGGSVVRCDEIGWDAGARMGVYPGLVSGMCVLECGGIEGVGRRCRCMRWWRELGLDGC